MIILICIAFTTKTLQNDTFYSIKVGESILKNGIDMKDHFSWHNLPYTYPHWLYDIGIYKIYDLGGWNAIYLSTIIIFIIIGITFYCINLAEHKSYFISLLFSILSIIMLARFITARAQLITYLLFLIEIYLIEKLTKTGHKRYSALLFLICILIANLHAAVWPFYFILMLPYLAEYLVALIQEKIKFKPNLGIFQEKIEFTKNKNIRLLFQTFLISLALGLLTPIELTPYTYFIKIIQGNTMNYIEEHKPLILIQNLFVIGYLFILLIPLIFTKVKIKLADLLMILGLLFMSFLAVRHVALLAIIGMFYLARLISNIGRIKKDKSLDFEMPVIGLLVITLTILITAGIVFNINNKATYLDDNIYPIEMVKYMKKNLDINKIRLYNEYDFGSYLIFNDIKVFIDSRSDLYTRPFNHKTDIFDECMKITQHYGRIFNKYKITHILIYKDTDLNQILAASSNYELVHKEGRFMLYKYLSIEA